MTGTLPEEHLLVVNVAVPSPLYKTFDYLVNEKQLHHKVIPGIRVRIPFGNKKTVGVVLSTATSSELAPEKLKHVLDLLDDEPLLPQELLHLAIWASDYYHYPIGEVVLNALPPALRRGADPKMSGESSWHLTDSGSNLDPDTLKKAPRQREVMARLTHCPDGVREHDFQEYAGNWRATLRTLVGNGWVEKRVASCLPTPPPTTVTPPPLNDAQQAATESVLGAIDAFGVFLLDGITGSGKTEVYLSLIEHALDAGRQALVLVPEIGLTPQLVKRFRDRFSVPIAVLHSGLTETQRTCAWLMAGDGKAPIVIGTRSAIFTPLSNPGLFIIDEEHDLSFKQQEGFRYSARDIAIKRAKETNSPIILGSATPSLESLQNVFSNRYQHLVLPRRAGEARPPDIHIVDVRGQRLKENLSAYLFAEIERHLKQAGQVLIFLNRRGFAPTLLCHHCGWVAECSHCDARLTLHSSEQRLRCHHCGYQRPTFHQCPSCQSNELLALGKGTERIDQALRERFPDVGLVRIDRDTTRRKGAMESLLSLAHEHKNQLLVGTQMLAKGHHFPNITLAAIVDVDHGFYSADFRASERMAQLILQVAGRAGRGKRCGEVIIQTHHPEHPMLHELISEGYQAFARTALAERRATGFPPFAHLVLLRAEATTADAAMQFLELARQSAEAIGKHDVELFGPLPAPMSRRAGKHRAQLLLQAKRRAPLHGLLNQWIPGLPAIKLARKVRWSVDVDPLELY